MMKNIQIEETPGQTTAGLTSASQIVNTTDASTFDIKNTSSDVPEESTIAVGIPPSPGILQCDEFAFKDALYRTMRHQGEILDVLAKL